MKLYLKTKDFAVSGENFDLLYDKGLDMLRTHPVPEDLDLYYESEDYISHTDASESIVDKLYQLVKKISLRRKSRLIQRYTSKEPRVLDVGAGTGDFVGHARNQEWEACGVEPNPKARSLAKEKGIFLYPNMEELRQNSFNVITLWHVLEHLPNLEAQIDQLVRQLEDEGILVVAVPNFKSFDAQFYGKFWAAYDVPRHLWHFSKNSMVKLFSNRGLHLISVKPMIFDSYYVSMLSEQYKSGKGNLIKAALVGLWSNFSAIRSGEYSSLIYIFRKTQKRF